MWKASRRLCDYAVATVFPIALADALNPEAAEHAAGPYARVQSQFQSARSRTS